VVVTVALIVASVLLIDRLTVSPASSAKPACSPGKATLPLPKVTSGPETLDNLLDQPSPGAPVQLLDGYDPALVGFHLDSGYRGDIALVVLQVRGAQGHIPHDVIALRGFDPRTGKIAWTLPAAEFGLTEPAVADVLGQGSTALLIVIDYTRKGDYRVFSLDVATGRLSKSFIMVGDAEVRLAGGSVVVVDDADVTAYRPTDLSAPIWQRPSSKDVHQFYQGDLGVIGDAWVYTADGFVTAADGQPTGLGTEPLSCAFYMQANDGSLFRVVQTIRDNFPANSWPDNEVWLWDAYEAKPVWPEPLLAETSRVVVSEGKVYLMTGHDVVPFTIIATKMDTWMTAWSAVVTDPGQPCTFMCGGAAINRVGSSWLFGRSTNNPGWLLMGFAVRTSDGTVIRLGESKRGVLEVSAGVVYYDADGALQARALDDHLTPLWSFALGDGQTVARVGDHLALLDPTGTLSVLS